MIGLLTFQPLVGKREKKQEKNTLLEKREKGKRAFTKGEQNRNQDQQKHERERERERGDK